MFRVEAHSLEIIFTYFIFSHCPKKHLTIIYPTFKVGKCFVRSQINPLQVVEIFLYQYYTALAIIPSTTRHWESDNVKLFSEHGEKYDMHEILLHSYVIINHRR